MIRIVVLISKNWEVFICTFCSILFCYDNDTNR